MTSPNERTKADEVVDTLRGEPVLPVCSKCQGKLEWYVYRTPTMRFEDPEWKNGELVFDDSSQVYCGSNEEWLEGHCPKCRHEEYSPDVDYIID